MKNPIHILFSFILIWISNPIHAQAKVSFTMPIGLLSGLGSMGDSSDHSNRLMSLLAVHAMPAVKIKKFILGPSFHYRFSGQVTDPSQVSDVNLGGSGYDIGAGFGWVGQRFSIRAIYDFLSNHQITIPAFDGSDSIYQKGSGYKVLISYLIKANSKVTLDLAFMSLQFKEQLISNSTTDLSGKPMKNLFGSIGLSFWMGPKSK